MQGITRKQVNEAVSYQDEIRKIDAAKLAEAEKAVEDATREAELIRTS